MSKKRKHAQTRAAPTQKRSDTSWLCSVDAYNILTAGQYRRMSDCPEVKMCVHVYADLISNMTLYLMQNTNKGDIRIKNELSRKMDINPNNLMTSKTFIYNLVWTLMLPGNGNQVTYPRYNTDGYLDNLEPFKPSSVTFVDTPTGYAIRYGGAAFSPDEVLHFVINPDPERPWIGTGYRAVLKDVLKGLKQAGTTKQSLLESPAPSIIIKVDALTEEFSSYEGRKKLSAQYLDANENGRPWFIPADQFEVQQVKPLTLNDLALAKNLEIDKRTVAGIFTMPPFLVGVGSFNKDEYNNFIGSQILSKAKVIEQELTRKLLYSPDLYWRFNPRSLYSYSLTEIIQAGSEMTDRIAMRRNEWRDWIGMSPDADMEELLALENYIPADKLGDQKKLNGSGSDENDENGKNDGDPPGVTASAEEEIAKISLNGAQIQSLLQIVQAVVANQLEYDSAIALITAAFPFDEALAKVILGDPTKLEEVGGGDEDGQED
jgi:HK97 family phage portal protein